MILYLVGAEKSLRIIIDNLRIPSNYNLNIIILDSKDPIKEFEWCKKRKIRVIFIGKSKIHLIFKMIQIFYIPLILFFSFGFKNNNLTVLSFQGRSNYISILSKLFFNFKVIISERILVVIFIIQKILEFNS